MAATDLCCKFIESPVGRLKGVASDRGLVAILWSTENPKRVRLGELREDAAHPLLLRAEQELAEYFDGSRRIFNLSLDLRGTPFQKQVWEALLAIPFGETRTYSQLATQLGRPQASRAVGAANGKNPVSIVVPCHRVIGASGALTGFAGGMQAKACLLKHEGARC